ncbi:MAG: hypothetical protein GEV10_29640, partial [Streptosporangiales bacterium]|nr:hypothetical protein [Streptosporangiales bacterium]
TPTDTPATTPTAKPDSPTNSPPSATPSPSPRQPPDSHFRMNVINGAVTWGRWERHPYDGRMVRAGRAARARLAVPLLFLLLLAGVLVAHGLGPLVRHAESVAHPHVATVHDVREPVGGIAAPPCRHPGDDGGQDAGHGDPSCVAPGAGAGPTLPAVLPIAADPAASASARHGVDQTTAAERGPPSLAELQRLRL